MFSRQRSSRRSILTRAAVLGAGVATVRALSGRAAEANGETVKVGGTYYNATSITEMGGNFNGQVLSIFNDSPAPASVSIVTTLAAPYPTNISPAALLATAGSLGAVAVMARSKGIAVRAESEDGTGIYSVTNSPSNFAAISGENLGGGLGVFGTAHSDKPGVLGSANSGPGVRGSSLSGPGISAEGALDGVVGVTTGSEAGVHGMGGTAARAGVVGEHPGSAPGVLGQSARGSGVFGSGIGTGATGVEGTSTDNGIGVRGIAAGAKGTGVLGVSNGGGNGVVAQANGAKAAVLAVNLSTGNALVCQSAMGRGASFAGPVSNIRLVPSTADTHPVSGLAGDLYVDKQRRLWFCKRGGTNAAWVQLA